MPARAAIARGRAERARAARLVFGLVAVMLYGAAPAQADAADDIYRQKPVTLTVSGSAGGGYDTLARTVARFLGRHLPGQPVVIVRNMAGQGGMAAARFLFANAEKDGSQIGLLQSEAAFAPLLGAREARFDASKFAWLGSPGAETGLFAVWHATPVRTLDDARQRETTVGTAGPGSTAAFHARLFNDVLGTRLKPVSGYPGQTEAFYAMEHGELEGYPSVLYSGLMVTRPDWLAQQTIRPLLAFGAERPRELAGVPQAREVAASDDDRLLLAAAFAPLELGRPFVMPPGAPADRVAIMRKALADTFADPDFAAESKRLMLAADAPRDGEALADVIRRTYATPARVLERLRKLHGVQK